jgi:hypothetical protein
MDNSAALNELKRVYLMFKRQGNKSATVKVIGTRANEPSEEVS